MLEYDRIDISAGVDINKTNLQKKCELCHYWYFKDIDFKYVDYLCNGYHDLMQKAMSFNNAAIVGKGKGSVCRIYFQYMSKDDVKMYISECNSIDSTDLTYYQNNRDVILNGAKDYYENDKERLRGQVRDKYRNLSEDEKNKKREYGRNRYRNMSEEKKQRLKEYQKNYREAKKSQYNNE